MDLLLTKVFFGFRVYTDRQSEVPEQRLLQKKNKKNTAVEMVLPATAFTSPYIQKKKNSKTCRSSVIRPVIGQIHYREHQEEKVSFHPLT